MTVEYSSDVFTTTGRTGLFLKLLRRWRGSIYKLIWRDLAIYITIYFFLSGVYRLILTPDRECSTCSFIIKYNHCINTERTQFEKLAKYCDTFSDYIPITFVLGFYVNLIVQRWWSQFELLPWPDSASGELIECQKKLF